MTRFVLTAALLALSLPLFADTLTFRETSQGKTTQETATLTRLQDQGLQWEVVSAKDSTTRSGRTEQGTLLVVEVDGKDGKWALRAEGDTLKASGTYQGKPVTGSLTLNGRPWSLGFDQPLKLAVSGKLTKPLTFLMANPVEVSKPTEMVLTPDGNDVVEGRAALRYKLGLPGAMSLFWSAQIWADPVTGEQVQYKGNKGPGTPDVVLVISRKN